MFEGQYPIIFISYRHSDSRDIAERIDADLCNQFGEENIFIDYRYKVGGEIIEDVVLDAAANCEVFLPIIGEKWLEEHNGSRRLDDPLDLLRREIEVAIKGRKRIIPIRVHNVSVPNKDELPDTIQPIVKPFWNQIRPGSDYERDLDILITEIINYCSEIGIRLTGTTDLNGEFELDEELKGELTDYLAFTTGMNQAPSQADRYVIYSALPRRSINQTRSSIIDTARSMLSNWIDANQRIGQSHPPKYWPHNIFVIPPNQRTGNKSLIREFPYINDYLLSRLLFSGDGGVHYASSTNYVSTAYLDKIPIFEIGHIIADLWRFAGLVAQFNTDLGYLQETIFCLQLFNTRGSHLGKFADKRNEPSTYVYWKDIEMGRLDLSCHSENLKYCQSINLLKQMEPKIIPDFIREIADNLSLDYNNDRPYCFEEATGNIPIGFFRTY